jgi:NADH-quinone oxidoreductase E subunit
VKSILKKFAGKHEELIPILQAVQQKYGYVSKARLEQIAEFVDTPRSAVYAVATFYSQFHLKRQGKYRIRVCQGTACHVKGGKRLLEAIEQELKIKQGQTTPNYKFSLERVACFGACALAPVMVINDRVYGRMSPSKARKIIKKLA